MLRKTFFSRLNNWVVYLLLSAIIGGVIASTYFLIDYLRKEEIKRIELFATAMKYQQAPVIHDDTTLDLILKISESNTSVPVIITDAEGRPLGDAFMKNIPESVMKDPVKLNLLLKEMKSTYPPFIIQLPEKNQYVYYTNSPLLNYLRYSPLILGFLVFIYLFFSFWFLKTLKKTDEGFLWAGLAKETAHQIGTPLSSMIGWIEILRLENENSEGVTEIERDIHRLKIISERFSKIGSVPELNDLNLTETLQQNYEYLKTRLSKKVTFTLKLPEQDLFVPHNRILLSWVFENLIKNAVDAMKGEGRLEVVLYEKNENILIDFHDTGSGMTKSQARKAFKPGYSTKKRGWGLGLSLAKRVVNDFHKGSLRIAQSEPQKGTTFRITLKSPL
ncbi:sensor histidine kinase [Bergeyella sp. RCAD1439]|uniref:sensor histidine kinase n=1 Tax=Bergeyella anatis TaxID=3113737 RepID=UPI002E19A050|nr:HAMP domain-containing sensor histidine kinase [Bergeyella sp. RCAD1439]